MDLKSGPGETLSPEDAALWFRRKGYVKIYSDRMEEYLLLTKNGSIEVPNPEGYARYTVDEINALDGLPFEEVVVIHNAKKVFDGKISKPEPKKGRKKK